MKESVLVKCSGRGGQKRVKRLIKEQPCASFVQVNDDANNMGLERGDY